ncbi:MAG: CHASE2 domain-containing protein [Bacteroidota bacterium]
MSKASPPYRIWALTTFNALVMLLITFFWLRLPYTFGDEAFLIKWTALTKKSLLGIDPKPNPESVLFVDISQSKTTLDQLNAFGEPSPYHRVVITDRSQLAEFLAMIIPHRNETRLVLMDVLLDLPSEQDSLLQAVVDSLGSKILGVTHVDTSGAASPTVIQFERQAVATYRSAQGLFLKYPLLFSDSLPTVPLMMYEQLHQQELIRKGGIYRFAQGVSLPAPIVDFKVRNSDFRTGRSLGGESNFTIYSMGDILESRAFMHPEDQADFFQGKVVLIGDFYNDVHDTPFGKIPGLLVIYNAYLTLVGGENIVSFFWIVLLLITYWILSWRVFKDIDLEKPRWLVRLFKSKLGIWILNTLDEVVILILLTIGSYFLFNIHINVLILLVYIKVVEYIWDSLPRFKSMITKTAK